LELGKKGQLSVVEKKSWESTVVQKRVGCLRAEIHQGQRNLQDWGVLQEWKELMRENCICGGVEEDQDELRDPKPK